MFFTQKVYYNNKPILLTNGIEEYIQAHKIAEGYLVLKGAFSRNFRLAVEHLSKFTSLGVFIEDISKEALEGELYKLYKPVDAGGGVVFNEAGNVLMIFRRGKWDLPKGKKDEGENITACAVREVSEETGLQKLKIGEKICDTYHIYSQQGENLLKCTAWYNMHASSKEKLIPQKEENILHAKWIAEKDLSSVVYKSYEAIREVLKAAGLDWHIVRSGLK